MKKLVKCDGRELGKVREIVRESSVNERKQQFNKWK